VTRTLTVNKSSWHYFLATRFSDYPRGVDFDDLCGYSGYVIKGIFGLIAGIAVFAGAAYCFDDFIIGLIFSIIYHSFMVDIPGLTFIAIASAIILFPIFHMWISYTSDGFIPSLYRSYKNKFCMEIEFKE